MAYRDRFICPECGAVDGKDVHAPGCQGGNRFANVDISLDLKRLVKKIPKTNWDDNEAINFIKRFSRHKSKKKACKRVLKTGLKFTVVKRSRIHRKAYQVWWERLQHHKKRFESGKSIGTLFCRRIEKGKWKGDWRVKDGNHRFLVLAMEGVTKFRVAYDERNEI